MRELIVKFKNVKSIIELSNVLIKIVEGESTDKGITISDEVFESLSLDTLVQVYTDVNHEYKRYEIPKKSGGKRIIHAPSKPLKNIQKVIALVMQRIYEPSPVAYGFIKGRSILSNAEVHVGKKFILNIDLKDFFPSVSEILLIKTLTHHYGFSGESAKLITRLCVRFGKLPQGSPASPVLTNMITLKLDQRLERFAHVRGLRYTRYVDDITFSGDSYMFTSKFEAKLSNIIRDEGFRMNLKKTRILGTSDRQEVTGIVINEKINVNRKFVRKVRAMIHNLEISGIHEDQIKGGQQVLNLSTLRTIGSLNFIGQVRGKDDALYQKMVQKLNSIIEAYE